MTDLKSALEAVLFAAGESVPVGRLSLVFAVEQEDIMQAAKELSDEYDREGRGIRLLRMDNMLQLCSAPEYADYIRAALETRKPPKLTQAALEVLSVVAYFQPVTRAYIESVRGVDSSYTVSVLEERGLIESCGHLDAPGRPTLFRTTPNFLRTFGLSSLQELPELPEEGAEGEDQLKLQSAIDTLSKAAEENETEAAEEAQ